MNVQPKIDISILNLERALGELNSYIGESTGRRIEKSGIIQAFEFSYEAFWNLFRKIAESLGKPAPMPRLAIGAAFQLGLIDNETTWIKMMKDRNLTSHTYNEKTADRIHDMIVKEYAPEMNGALKNIKQKLKKLSLD